MAIKISKNRLDMGSTPIKNVSYQDLDQVATQVAPATSKTRLYSKTDGALYVVPAAGSETAAGVPANGIIHTTATSAPTGWAEYTAGRGVVIVGTPSGGTHAGTVGTALTDLENRTHDHTYTTVIAHTHTYTKHEAYQASGGYALTANQTNGSNTTASTGSASGTTATGTALPPYVQLLGIQKSA